MKISELGESGLVRLLNEMVLASQDKSLKPWQQLILGIGDDTAAWRGDTTIQLATVDSLRQDTHFSFETISWRDLGWKAMAINISDIAAMGGIPRYALVALAVPDSTEVDNIKELYAGLIEAARAFEVAIIGGDTDSARLIDITTTLLGSTRDKDSRILTRSTARTGDKVAVTGYLGAAAGGLQMLSRHLKFDPEAADILKNAFTRPCPRVAEGQTMVEQGVKTAIDVSDGLIRDIGHICEASKVGAKIEVHRVPVHPAVKSNFGKKALELALSGGEDYELLFTASEKTIEKVKANTSCPVTVIGEIVEDKSCKVLLVDSKGKPVEVPKTGWEHFTTKLDLRD